MSATKETTFVYRLRHLGADISIYFREEPTRELFEYIARFCEFEKEHVPPLVATTEPSPETKL